MKAKRQPAKKPSSEIKEAPGCSPQLLVRPLVVDGFEFESSLDAALHLLWLLQRLSYYEKHREGQPCDGFRFREGIIASRKLLRKLKYKVGELKRPIRS